MAQPNEEKAKGISFGFAKVKTTKIVKPPDTNKSNENDDKDLIIEVRDNKIESTKPKNKKEPLVIPVILNNVWCKPDHSSAPGEGQPTSDLPDNEKSLREKAIVELLRDAAERSSQQGNSSVSGSRAIVQLLQNRPPGDFETDDKVDVSLRPSEPDPADYAAVPIEEFGFAMLRGMGWKEGEGIGLTNKQVVKPFDVELRPKGLGLGADRSALKDLEETKVKRPKPGDPLNKDNEVGGFTKGACLLITSGTHRGLYGVIEGTDEDNNRVMVQLAISKNTVTLSQYSVQLVTKKEFEKHGRCINKSKYEEYQERIVNSDPERKKESERSQEGERERESRRETSPRERRDEKKKSKKEKSKKKKRKHSPSPDRSSRKGDEPTWLRDHLRVRIIDKHFQNGKYYNEKVTIEDVLTPSTCVCRTNARSLLEDVHLNMLETVIPKEEMSTIMILRGKHRFKVGMLISKNRSKYEAAVQLFEDREKLLKFDFDDICEYAGDVSKLAEF